MGLFRCDAERYVVVWQSGNGRDVIGLDGCVLAWQSWMGRVRKGELKVWYDLERQSRTGKVWWVRVGCGRMW